MGTAASCLALNKKSPPMDLHLTDEQAARLAATGALRYALII